MKEHSEIVKENFQKTSSFIYDLLEVVNQKDEVLVSQVNENGISSIILKKIAKLKDSGIFIKAKNLEVLENKTGIDFDIWIGENDEEYIRLIVQAKSFHNKTSTDDEYETFDLTQCKKLIKTSEEEHESFPLYFFYQHIIDKNLEQEHFKFIEDFKHEFSSITFSSAFSIKKLIESNQIKFSDIHRNEFDNKWNNNIYSLFEEEDEKIGLPFYLLYDISPSKIKSFQNLIKKKNNYLHFFFFFLFGEKFPFKIHKITAKKIEELYGKNNSERNVQVRNLLIINDNNKAMRDREKEINKVLND